MAADAATGTSADASGASSTATHAEANGDNSQRWLEELRDGSPRKAEATERLHDLLRRVAQFELRRRSTQLAHVRGESLDDLATQAADDALVALLSKLDTYRGDSRFTTWTYKFVLLEASVKVRQRAWQGREVPVADDGLSRLGGEGPPPERAAATSEFLHEVGAAIDEVLTPHQREVLVALALNGVPIDVLAEHLNTSRGALYKTLHDARRKLREALEAKGLSPERPDEG